MSKNIVLTGFMGVGKSSVSNYLSKEYGREIFSTDLWIEAQEGRSITEIFAESGESYFRDMEKKAVMKASSKDNQIIDCGGGVILNQENIELLSQNGIIFYLWASAQMLYGNIKKSGPRPLLQVDDPLATIEQMLKQRDPLYRQRADVILDTDNKTCDQIAREVADVFNRY